MDWVYLLVFLIVVILLCILITYNSIITKRNKARQSKSSIDVYLNQRFDLIPNLVECVKGYMSYEKELLEEITKLRSEYNNSKSLNEASVLNNKCNSVLAVAENYPDLKANQNFLSLQKSLEKMESQLQAARRLYNTDVTAYNTKIHTVPTNIIAKVFGFKDMELFQIEEFKKENIDVNL